MPGYPAPPKYEAQASVESPSQVPALNAYDVPLKVEETESEEDQDVYFIFYEEDTADETPQLQGYVSEAAVPPAKNQFKAPDDEDIR